VPAVAQPVSCAASCGRLFCAKAGGACSIVTAAAAALPRYFGLDAGGLGSPMKLVLPAGTQLSTSAGVQLSAAAASSVPLMSLAESTAQTKAISSGSSGSNSTVAVAGSALCAVQPAPTSEEPASPALTAATPSCTVGPAAADSATVSAITADSPTVTVTGSVTGNSDAMAISTADGKMSLSPQVLQQGNRFFLPVVCCFFLPTCDLLAHGIAFFFYSYCTSAATKSATRSAKQAASPAAAVGHQCPPAARLDQPRSSRCRVHPATTNSSAATGM